MTPPLDHLVRPGLRVYFLGIGGIGMSALARWLVHAGCHVRGYDRTPTPLTAQLAAEGIAVTYDMDTAWLADTDLVVRTPAVKDHPGLALAEQAGLPVLKRAELLGAISRTRRTAAVAGTHGKTTTSSLLAHLLAHGGTGATAFVGGILAGYESNLILGKGQWLVCEADEFDRSFLHLVPEIAALTSLDADHLDIYGSPEAMRESYAQFARQVSGRRLLHATLRPWALAQGLPAHHYALNDDGSGAIHAQNLRSEGLRMHFDYRAPATPDGSSPEVVLRDLVLPMPGAHNVENALAAITLARWAGLPGEAVRSGLASFAGVHRRFQVHIDTPALVYVDDYAHHPAEIAAVLGALRSLLPKHQLVAAFQPHLFTRTRDFHAEFGAALSQADSVFLLPIYPARELSIPHVSSDLIYQHIHTTYKHLVSLDDLTSTLPAALRTPAAVVTLGAGDIDTRVQPLRAALQAWQAGAGPGANPAATS